MNAVLRFSWWMVPTARVIYVDWLAILSGIVHLTIRMDFFRTCTAQWPLLKTSYGTIITAHGRVTNEELMVALMVHIHADLNLHSASCNVGSMRLLYRLYVVHGAGPLTAITTNRPSAISAMWTVAVSRPIDDVPSRRFDDVSVALG